MVVSTGGHWTSTLFKGYKDDGQEGGGIEGVVSFFEHVAKRWVQEVQDRLASEQKKEREVRMDASGRPGVLSFLQPNGTRASRRKNVIVRAYLPGHDGCRESKEPLAEVPVLDHEVYNWRHIWKYNHIFEVRSSLRRHSTSKAHCSLI